VGEKVRGMKKSDKTIYLNSTKSKKYIWVDDVFKKLNQIVLC